MNISVDKQFSAAQKKQVQKLFASGKTQKEIGEQLGYPRRTIGKLCKHLGLKRSVSEAASISIKSDLDSPETLKIIQQMREAGESLKSICDVVGGSISAMERICKKYGYEKPTIDYSNLKKEYESGLTIKQLSSKYGVSQVIIHKHLKRMQTKMRDPAVHGFKGAPPKKSKPSHQAIIDDYELLGSMSKVAAKYGYSVAGIRLILEKNGIEIRSTSEVLTGDGNPFFGQTHPDHIKKLCKEVGSVAGRKFWEDNPDYILIVKEKQRALWADIEKRKESSKLISELRAAGKCGSRKGSVETRFGKIDFDSSFELQLIEYCDDDKRVVDLERDFDRIEYSYRGSRHFDPDFRIWLSNGEFLIVEVKSDWLAMQPKERAKIEAAFGLMNTKFMVVNKNLDYLVQRIDSCFGVSDFSFSDIVLAEIDSSQYLPFYGCFHYLGKTGRRGYTLGAFLNDQLIGCATIGSVTRVEVATSLGKSASETRELVRFCIHPDFQKKNFASWMLSRVVKSYKASNPDISMLVSFADTTQGHSGTIYKAAGWEKVGTTNPSYHYVDKSGTIIHKKTIWDRAKEAGFPESIYAMNNDVFRVEEKPKDKYKLDLD